MLLWFVHILEQGYKLAYLGLLQNFGEKKIKNHELVLIIKFVW